MKPIKISQLPDNAEFKTSKYSKVVHTLQTKSKTTATYTANKTHRTYTCSVDRLVYEVK